jgi:hypothetical protein
LTTRVGYTGGDVPTYWNHRSLAKAVEIVFERGGVKHALAEAVLAKG